MNLWKHVQRFVVEALELGQLKDVVRLAAALFCRIINQHGVCLIPALAVGGSWVGGQDLRVVPDGRQALVDLNAGRVVGGGEAELVAGPDDDALGALLGGEQLRDHLVDVFGAGRGPDCDVEGVDAVVEELARMGALDEVEGVSLVGAVEQSSVEVHDDEYAARLAEGRGGRQGIGHVARRGIWDAAGCSAGDDALVLRGVFEDPGPGCWRGSHSGDVIAIVGTEDIGVVEPVELSTG